MRLKIPSILFFCLSLTYGGENSIEIRSQNGSQIGVGSLSDFVEIKKGSFGYGIFAKEFIQSEFLFLFWETLTGPVGLSLRRPLRIKVRIIANSSLIWQKNSFLFCTQPMKIRSWKGWLLHFGNVRNLRIFVRNGRLRV